MRVCFVCLGNICRSPTAEGVMQRLVREAGLEDVVEIDSAGTGAYHVGERPDSRSRETAARRGVELASRARQFVAADLARFDYVLAMDRANLRDLERLSRGRGATASLSLLRAFDPAAPDDADVPDPYYGGERGFDDVFELCEAACRGLLAHLTSEHDLLPRE